MVPKALRCKLICWVKGTPVRIIATNLRTVLNKSITHLAALKQFLVLFVAMVLGLVDRSIIMYVVVDSQTVYNTGSKDGYTEL